MPKDKYPSEPDEAGEGEKKRLAPYQGMPRYGTFGFVVGQDGYGQHEYGHAVYNNMYDSDFIFNEAGRKLFTNAFPGLNIKEILDILNTEFNDPLSKGYSHGLCLCTFAGDDINNIRIHSERGFGKITHSDERLVKEQKGYASDIGKDIVDKIFEDLVPYLQLKTEENAHLAPPPASKGPKKNDL